ncbi:hypothetical protein [Bradyrhizobium elkanii]|uniref:hypothetical protein n=1 Tax=Bradyrhizobium elkanii TaxID=29448 RepID=UPI0004B023D1|nr:hypothetical protein [Bradyrhizobium elkanii]WLA79625.1 hypothetical protein QNJ99_30040 [Bradyrhizobium elkanii]
MKLTIEFEKPPGADLDDVAQFVIAALSSWGGGLHPDDPMFHSLRGRIRLVVIHGRTFEIQDAQR